jgi:GNAT superfamily N-acetyltransferase
VSSTPSAAEVAALERVAYDLWVAPEVDELDGWLLRHAHGLTSRANSVWPNGAGRLPLEEKLEAVEAWYAARQLPTRFQITAAAQPFELVAALARRGYRQIGDPVSVELAVLPPPAVDVSVQVSEQLDPGWLELWAGSRSFGRPDIAERLLTGSPGRTAFARIGDVAVGRGVAVDGWLGITSMATVPAARRRGHARAIVAALSAWASEHGCTRALLQVEATNVAARALYAQLGFRPSHEYRYLGAL